MLKKVFVCPVTDIEDGKKKRVIVNGKALMVVHIDKDFFVTDDTCTHGQASLTAGTLDNHEIECPHHGGKFDVRTGEAKVLPAVSALTTYSTTIEEGKIFIEMEEVIPQTEKQSTELADPAPTVSEKKDPTPPSKPPFEVVCEGGICRIIRPQKD